MQCTRWSWLPGVATCYVSVLALLEMPFDQQPGLQKKLKRNIPNVFCGALTVDMNSFPLVICDLSDAGVLKGRFKRP